MTTRFASSWNTCLLRKKSLSRYYSSTTKKCNALASSNKAFTDTLLLPKTTFPLRPNLEDNENAYGDLTRDTLYRWQRENVKGPVFVLHDGPPYANGDLHMGHALNKVIKDIINRFHLSQGRRIHYIPGWDCHGLPIENIALKEMDQKAVDTPASIIRDSARTTALREVGSQKEQFKTLAIMADWNSDEQTYRTLDRPYEIRQLRIFQKMVAKGQIYRQHRPVHYSPSSRTALAEAELEYSDNHVSHSVYVTFQLDRTLPSANNELQSFVSRAKEVSLLVWTTTPWTLSANMAIAVHEDLTYVLVKRADSEDGILIIIAEERLEALGSFLAEMVVLCRVKGKELVGATYKPIFPASIESFPIIHAPHVTSQSGTGLVHCAPAHGAEDYEALRSHTTALLCHVDGKGQFMADIANVVGPSYADRLVGKEVLEDGNKEMVALLKEMGCVVKIQRLKHRYPYDWRTKKPIIVTATSQWFANLDFIKEDAITALKDVQFFPESSRNRLEAFVRSRSEWCISRQRVWGVPIPALEHIATGRVVLDSSTLDYILNAMESKNLDWWEAPIAELVPPWLLEEGKSAEETWAKGRDTMDVWFDSGSSWSMLPEMGVGRDTHSAGALEGSSRSHHADLCLEGSDQHRGWFQSQLLTAIGSRDPEEPPVSPYANLFTHGMVLDEKGKKMSKSLGNIISPMTIVHGSADKKKPANGPDFLRLWAASVDFWKDMSIGPIVMAQTAESLRKFRNTARFCLGNMGSKDTLDTMERVPRSKMGLSEKYVMHELYTLEQTALEAYSSYNFPRVVHALNNFVNNTVSSFYFDITKDCLYADSVNSHQRRAVVTVLEQILGTLTKIISPILPHLAEEIHATWKGDGKSVFMTPWTPLNIEWKDDQSAQDMSQLMHVRNTVLSLLEKARREKQVKSSLEADVDIVIPETLNASSMPAVLRREATILPILFIVSRVSVIHAKSDSPQPQWYHETSIPVTLSEEQISIRIKPCEQSKCPRCWTYTRSEEDRLCQRCEKVVETDHNMH